MENFPDPIHEQIPEEQTIPVNEIIFPPKFEKKEQPANIWLKSFLSLALYLILGYYIFPSYKILLLITAIVMLHELGHFFAMKYFHYSDLGIFFIPLLGAYVSGTKREVSQKQSAIILLAGPLPGIIIGIILYLIDENSSGQYFLDISFSRIAILMIILNLINLFPVYPLDGGQLLNRVFLDEEGVWGKIFIFLSSAVMCWIAFKLPFYALLIFPALMLLRLFSDNKLNDVEKKIETHGINMDKSYDELSDEDYWKIRNILIEEHSAFKDIPAAPPFEYNKKEEKVMTMIQSLLHRHLIQDVSVAGKIFILLIWVAAIASPWLIKMDMSFFQRFGF
ncbi:MAG: site-2 protease family protein [Chitinophagaceae bacterium]